MKQFIFFILITISWIDLRSQQTIDKEENFLINRIIHDDELAKMYYSSKPIDVKILDKHKLKDFYGKNTREMFQSWIYTFNNKQYEEVKNNEFQLYDFIKEHEKIYLNKIKKIDLNKTYKYSFTLYFGKYNMENEYFPLSSDKTEDKSLGMILNTVYVNDEYFSKSEFIPFLRVPRNRAEQFLINRTNPDKSINRRIQIEVIYSIVNKKCTNYNGFYIFVKDVRFIDNPNSNKNSETFTMSELTNFQSVKIDFNYEDSHIGIKKLNGLDTVFLNDKYQLVNNLTYSSIRTIDFEKGIAKNPIINGEYRSSAFTINVYIKDEVITTKEEYRFLLDDPVLIIRNYKRKYNKDLIGINNRFQYEFVCLEDSTISLTIFSPVSFAICDPTNAEAYKTIQSYSLSNVNQQKANVTDDKIISNNSIENESNLMIYRSIEVTTKKGTEKGSGDEYVIERTASSITVYLYIQGVKGEIYATYTVDANNPSKYYCTTHGPTVREILWVNDDEVYFSNPPHWKKKLVRKI